MRVTLYNYLEQSQQFKDLNWNYFLFPWLNNGVKKNISNLNLSYFQGNRLKARSPKDLFPYVKSKTIITTVDF